LQLERERFAHNITRETLRVVQREHRLQVQQELELPKWKRKLLNWLRKGFN
jgi:hypothetical protein